MDNELEKVKIELINLYLNIKIRTQEEVDSLTEGDIIQEAENIINLPLLDLIQYVKSTIDIIVSTKVESKINDYKNSLNEDNNAATDYETLLQKLEQSLRQHIAYEHQFKIEYEKLLIKAEEIDYEKKQLKNKVEKLEKGNKNLKNRETNLKEQIETKEKELIQSQIKLKELKAINSANNFYSGNINNNTNNNNYKTKSYISKSNSSINIYKDNLTEKKDNINYFNNNMNNKNLNLNNNSLLNNLHTKKRYNKIRKTNITNPNVTLDSLTLSLQNMKKMSNSKTKQKKKYNNSTNYFNKKYINNLTTILFLREPNNKYRKKERNKSLHRNNRNMNKSMLDLFPSRNINYFVNNNNNNKKYINNNYNINNYIINNSNKRKKTKSVNITHNTINMNKNSVLINLNANIINTKTPIEKFKVQQKLMEYKKYISRKLYDFTKKNKKNVQIIPPPSNKNYKKINKYSKKKSNKRKISPYQNVQNIKLNFNSMNSSSKNNSKKSKFDFYSNIIQKSSLISNNPASRSSSTNSKSSMNIPKKSNKNSNKIKLAKRKNLTLKNFVFSKK